MNPSPHWPPHPAEQSPPVSLSPSSLHGRRIGPYQLERELGRGGMGSVWLARRDDGQFEGSVAIKLLVAAWLGSEGEIRFRREGTLLARLNHPNIARLLDAGVTDTAEPYLVLEYIEGRRIDEYCNAASLSVRERVRLFLQLLAAVAHAHRNLIVHRDIKPANVLVTSDGTLKLLDFGIGKLMQDQDALLTRTGHTMLTPEYAAPEQLLGEPVTTSTDIYALGLLLYLLLSGRLPYAESLASPAELIRRITDGVMPLPSSIAVSRTGAQGDAPSQLRPKADRELRSELRGDLDNIVFKALHPMPEHRYEDVGAFATDLQRFLNHEPVSARAGNLLYRIGKFVRRNRLGVATAALVLIMAWVGSSMIISQSYRARARSEEAANLGRTMEMLSDFLNMTAFASGGPDRPTLTPTEQVERTAAMLERVYANDLDFAGQMLMQLAEQIPNNVETELPMRLLQRAYELGEKSGDLETLVSSRCLLAIRRVAKAEPEVAAALIAQAEQRMDDPRLRQETRIHCMIARAQLASARGQSEAAAVELRAAMRIIEVEELTSRSIYTHLMSLLVSVYLQQSKFADAIDVVERSMRISQQTGEVDGTNYLSSLQNRAVLRMYVGEVAQSLADREQIERMSRRFYAADSVPFPMLHNHAAVLLRMGRAESALALMDGAMARARAADNPPQLVQMLHYKAWAHLELQQWPLAASTLEEAQLLVEQGAAAPHWASLIEARWAELALGHKDAEAARRHVAKALSVAGYGTQQPERALPRILLLAAEVALAAGQSADAAKFASEALQISERVARNELGSADVGESLLLLDKAHAASDTPAARRGRLERAVENLRNGLHAQHPRVLEATARLLHLPR